MNNCNKKSELRMVINLIIAYVSSKDMANVEVSRNVKRFTSSANDIEQQTIEVNEFTNNAIGDLVDLGFKEIGSNVFRLGLPKQFTFEVKLLTAGNTVTVDAKISNR